MERRTFLKMAGIVPAVVAVPSIAIPTTNSIWKETPSTLEDLKSLINKYTIHNEEYLVNSLGDRSNRVNGELNRPFYLYSLSTDPTLNNETLSIRKMWSDIRYMIANGGQTVYWRRVPEINYGIQNDDYSRVTPIGDKDYRVTTLSMRLRFEPFHNHNDNLDCASYLPADRNIDPKSARASMIKSKWGK